MNYRYTVPFGSSADHSRLGDLAKHGGGTMRAASSGSELRQVFGAIAAECNAMDGLLRAFGDVISSMVVQKLLLDYY